MAAGILHDINARLVGNATNGLRQSSRLIGYYLVHVSWCRLLTRGGSGFKQHAFSDHLVCDRGVSAAFSKGQGFGRGMHFRLQIMNNGFHVRVAFKNGRGLGHRVGWRIRRRRRIGHVEDVGDALADGGRGDVMRFVITLLNFPAVARFLPWPAAWMRSHRSAYSTTVPLLFLAARPKVWISERVDR